MNQPRQSLPPEINEAACQFLHQFQTLIRLVGLYDRNNEVFAQPLQEFEQYTQTLLAFESRLEFRFVENDAYLNRTRIRFQPELRAAIFELLHDLRSKMLGGLALSQALPLDHALGLFSEINAFFKSGEQGLPLLETRLIAKGLNILEFFSYQEFGQKIEKKADAWNFKHPDILKTYVRLLNYVQIISHITPGKNPTVFVDALRKIQRLLQKLIDEGSKNPQIFLLLTHLDLLSEPAAAQSINVALFSAALGRFIGIKKIHLIDLALAGLFHNRPHWHIPIEQFKPGTLPYLHSWGMAVDGGFNPSICRRMVSGFLWQHPKTRSELQPDLFTKIISIAAHYQHMITPQTVAIPGLGLTPYHALKYLFREKNLGVDPVLVKMFVNLLGVYPVGTVVLLDTGELGVITAPPINPQKIHCPTVQIIRFPGGDEITCPPITLENDSRKIARAVPAAGVDVQVAQVLFEMGS